MVEKLKTWIKTPIIILSSLLAFFFMLFLRERKKKNDAESRKDSAFFEGKEFILKDTQGDVKKEIEKVSKTPLSQDDIEKHWNNK